MPGDAKGRLTGKGREVKALEILGKIEGFLGDKGGALRIGGIIRQQCPVAFYLDAAAGSGHHQGLGAALKLGPPGVDVLPRQRLRLRAGAQMQR